jgi:hypothetical protein
MPDFVTDVNNKAEEQNKKIRSQTTTITRRSNFLKEFELMIYHTLHKESCTITLAPFVYFIMYLVIQNLSVTRMDQMFQSQSLTTRTCYDLIKFNKAGIHDTTTLMLILSGRTDTDAMAAPKLKFNSVGLKGINTSTVKILREENNRSLEHCEFNCLRYHTMETEIGADAMMKTFPTYSTLLHHVVSCVAINQDRRKPNRWVNKITQKLIDAGIISIE